MEIVTIYIGLGSNLDNPIQHIRDAIDEIKLINEFELLLCSSLYKTPPMGPQNQADYINAVMKIQSRVTPVELLDRLQKIEQIHGRVRKERWGARSLDLEILFFGNQVVDTNRLKIPHIGLYVRAFVLYPLLEVEPDFILPNGISLVEHIELMGKQDIIKII